MIRIAIAAAYYPGIPLTLPEDASVADGGAMPSSTVGAGRPSAPVGLRRPRDHPAGLAAPLDPRPRDLSKSTCRQPSRRSRFPVC
jgi:hypothetical protein